MEPSIACYSSKLRDSGSLSRQRSRSDEAIPFETNEYMSRTRDEGRGGEGRLILVDGTVAVSPIWNTCHPIHRYSSSEDRFLKSPYTCQPDVALGTQNLGNAEGRSA